MVREQLGSIRRKGEVQVQSSGEADPPVQCEGLEARAWPRSEGRGPRAEAPPPAPAPPAAPRPSAATLGSSWSRGAWSRGARRPAVSGVPASPAARPHVRHVSSHLFPGVWEQGS